MSSIPVFISSKGGSITCHKGDTGRLFRSCSRTRCVYSSDLHSAKAILDSLECYRYSYKIENTTIPAQRKTTMKWNSNGELSAIDMARVLDRISNQQLTECELACNFHDHFESRGVHHSAPTSTT